MISAIVAFFSIALVCCIGSVDAFTTTPSSVYEYKLRTHLKYRNLNEQDEWCSTQTSHRLPSGAFGILPQPTTSTDDQAVAVTTYKDSSASDSPSLRNPYTFIEAEYLIPPSNVHSTSTTRYYSHGNNFDLPASSSSYVMDKNDNFQKSVEISVGRIAMMAAVVLIGEEVCTGASLPELIAKLVVQ